MPIESTDRSPLSGPGREVDAARFRTPSDDPGLWVEGAPIPHARVRRYQAMAYFIGLPTLGLVVMFTRTPLALWFFGDTAYLESGSAVQALVESLLWTVVTGLLLFRVIRMRTSYRGFPDKALRSPGITVEVQAVTVDADSKASRIYVISTEEAARPPKWAFLLDRRADGTLPEVRDQMLLYLNTRRGPYLLQRDEDGRWFSGC